ncbi:hypothetical protein [Endozoicomonas arenosclerae]|uniref:hypothetical protein n=1 Tax=Endozoicomonas arenosclerae TaxID=1633495 RepID=UPI0007827155|nr:hypothetical protein [Endozoicomonas arenosclerae]
MQIYKVVSDPRYGVLFPDLIAIGQQLDDPSEFMEAISSAKSLQSSWINLEGTLDDPDKPGDLCRTQINHLTLSSKAKEQLQSVVSDSGELLPFSFEGDSWYLLNVLNSIPAKENESRINQYSAVEAIAFSAKDLENQMLWTSSFGYDGDIYCSDKFIEVVEKAGLTGLGFEKIYPLSSQ